MCGIVGLFGPTLRTEALPALLQSMCQAIIHRGPDDEGIFVDREIGLGMRRLSIIDVAGGHQPIQNENKKVTIVFNGEIYNFHALRDQLESRGHQFQTRTDTETIVHAYEESGTECVNRLNGIFAFALWDAEARRLLLARDRMGVKPLYYTRWGSGLAFASEIKALLKIPEVDRTLDLEATAQFFRLGFVTAPLTLFRGIYKLPPGTLLVATEGGIRTEAYWNMEFRPRQPTANFAECSEELRELLQRVVADQMISDVPLGAFLSGGVDSSAIVAFMRQAATNGVRTYSIGFEQQHAYHNETPYAEAVARKLGTEHETLIVRPQVADLLPALIEKMDEPLTDTSFLVTYLISKLAHQHVKVALSGVGGDELFGGYRRYYAPMLYNMASWIPPDWRRIVGTRLSDGLSADRGTFWGNMGRYTKTWGRTIHLTPGEQYLGLVSVLTTAEVAMLLKPVSPFVEPAKSFLEFYNEGDTAEALHRLFYVDSKTALPESLLLLTDKMGMATSLEVRVPFLDNRLVDFVCRLPCRYLMRGFTLKRLLKAALKGIVPDLVLKRPKRGFGTPMGTWLRTDLRPMVRGLLATDRFAREGLFDGEFVKHLLAAHYRGTEDYTEAIFALLTFEVWRDRFQVRLP